MRLIRRLLTLLQAHRRQLGRWVGLTGALLVLSQLLRGTPRTIEVQLDLGPTHLRFTEVRVAYVQAGEELHAALFSFPEGAPGRLQHTVRLPAGDFEVHTELRPSHGNVVGSVEPLHAPSDEPVQIRIAESIAPEARETNPTKPQRTSGGGAPGLDK